jgi:predicted transposase/invertase (TIGR01784 family)
MATQNPHDALFRHVFSRTENAAGELRAVLPEALAARIDWASLELVDGRFVDPALADRETDLLFAANIAGHDGYVYLLLEHQSTVDQLMPLRLLRYLLRIWDRWLADHPAAKRIPVIVPVVLYHGERAGQAWTAATAMHQIFDLDDTTLGPIRAFVPSFELLLDDLSRQDDEHLRARAMQALGVVALLLLKHARAADDLLAKMVTWAGMLREVLEAPNGLEALRPLMRYTMLVSEHVTVGDINALLVPAVGEQLREVVMTEGQRLIEKGRVEGEAKGEARGEARGEAKGRANAVLAVLTARGIAVPEPIRARIMSCTEVATLDAWLARAVTASSAAEVVAEG